MKFLEQSLRNKIVFYFLSIILICVLFISYISYLSAKDSIIQSIKNQLVNVLHIKKNDLTHWLNQQAQKVDFICEQKELIERTEKMLEHGTHFNESKAYDEIKNYFAEVFSKFNDFKEYELLYPIGGTVLLSNVEKYIGEFRANDSYFINSKNKLHIQGVYPSVITSDPTIVISAPIRNDRKVIAVLAIKLNLTRVNEIKTITAYSDKNMHIYLIDNYNMFITSDKYDIQKFPRGVHSYAIDKAIKGGTGSGVYDDFMNEQVIGAYTWVPDLNVAIILEVRYSSAIKPAGNLARAIVIAGLILSVIAAVIIVFASKKISGPILAIEKTALRVSLGDFLAKASVSTRDEVGILAASFNEMTEKLFKREKELSELNLDLDKKVKERTEELQNLNKDLESFSYSISHDLRAPLRSISGFTQIVKEDYESNLDDEGKLYLNKIAGAAVNMEKLIEGILNLSKITRHDLKTQKINLSETADRIVKDYLILNPDKKTNVEIERDMFVLGDIVLITTLLSNLIDNAFKYSSKKNEIVIKMGCTRNFISGSNLNEYYISDNGAGFDMQYAGKLFREFQRLHQKSEFDGTGIGLANVRKILCKHGGNIRAESEPGKGATFYFTLPGA